ncbi:MAG: hypothetical protein Q7S52_02035 [bacterium]|nr:hypothetical protein [bacterium]
MSQLLIGFHAFLGEAGALMFLWVLVELLNPAPERLRRARIAAFLGTLLLCAAWVVGGYYYVEFYGPFVKPVIKAGPMAWAHSIAIETKEHVFLFLPFLAFLAFGLLTTLRDELLTNDRLRIAIICLSGLIVLIAFAMAGFGFVVTSGFRSALEALIT